MSPRRRRAAGLARIVAGLPDHSYSAIANGQKAHGPAVLGPVVAFFVEVVDDDGPDFPLRVVTAQECCLATCPRWWLEHDWQWCGRLPLLDHLHAGRGTCSPVVAERLS